MGILVVVAVLLYFEPEFRRFFGEEVWKAAIAVGLILELELYRSGVYKFFLRPFKTADEEEENHGLDWRR